MNKSRWRNITRNEKKYKYITFHVNGYPAGVIVHDLDEDKKKKFYQKDIAKAIELSKPPKLKLSFHSPSYDSKSVTINPHIVGQLIDGWKSDPDAQIGK